MATVKTDCILCEDKGGYKSCKGLNRLYCAEEEKCAFYKTAEQEVLQALKASGGGIVDADIQQDNTPYCRGKGVR